MSDTYNKLEDDDLSQKPITEEDNQSSASENEEEGESEISRSILDKRRHG